MNRLQSLNPNTTTGKSKELFDGIQAKLGMVQKRNWEVYGHRCSLEKDTDRNKRFYLGQQRISAGAPIAFFYRISGTKKKHVHTWSF